MASWLVLDSHPLVCLLWLCYRPLQTLSKDASPPSFLSLSMHGIQIISGASLCCCMEEMGVFELDLLDNIRSTQISFHARLLHAERVAHAGMLTWLLLLFLKKSLRNKLHTNVMLSPSQAPCTPICSLTLLTGRGTGREAERRPPQTDRSEMLFFMAWWTGLYRSAILAKLTVWRGRSDIWLLFWFPQTAYLRASWVESSCRRILPERKIEDTLWFQGITSLQSSLTHLGTNFACVVMVTSLCIHWFSLILFS